MADNSENINECRENVTVDNQYCKCVETFDECNVCHGSKPYLCWCKCDKCKNWFHTRCIGIEKNFPTQDEILSKCTICKK